jgi:hypothetical protein
MTYDTGKCFFYTVHRMPAYAKVSFNLSVKVLTSSWMWETSLCLKHKIPLLCNIQNQVQEPWHLSTVSSYRLDDWGSIPGRGKGFFL